MARDEDFRKHLDLVQAVVNRLAGNSFSVRTWSVGLIAVLGGLAVKDADGRLAIGLLLPAIGLWWLDAYYVREERLFRKLYEKVVADPPPTPPVPGYSMDVGPYDAEVASLGKIAVSRTVLAIHLSIIAAVLALIAYSYLSQPPTVPKH